MLIAQSALSGFASKRQLFGGHKGVLERATLVGQLLFLSTLALVGQLAGVLCVQPFAPRLES